MPIVLVAARAVSRARGACCTSRGRRSRWWCGLRLYMRQAPRRLRTPVAAV